MPRAAGLVEMVAELVAAARVFTAAERAADATGAAVDDDAACAAADEVLSMARRVGVALSA